MFFRNYCDELREKFDSAGIINPPSVESFDQGPMSFSQINLNQHPEWGEDVKKCTHYFTKYIEHTNKIVLLRLRCGRIHMPLKNFDLKDI